MSFTEKFKREAERLDIPAGLEPQVLQARLQQQNAADMPSARKNRFGTRMLASAAAVLLIVGGLLFWPGKQLPLAPGATKKPVGSYNELFSKLKGLQQSGIYDKSLGMPEAAANEDNTASPSTSRTNDQVSGVHEADIVAVSPRALYFVTGRKLVIARPDLSKLAEITFAENEYPVEMVLQGDRLAVVLSCWDNSQAGVGRAEPALDIGIGCWYGYGRTQVKVYNVSDPSQPELLQTAGQDGNYTTSRTIDGVLYLVTSFYPYSLDKSKPETFVPKTQANGTDVLLPAEDIYVAQNVEYAQYTVVSSVALATGEMVDAFALLQSGAMVYASRSNLYLAAYSYKQVKDGNRVTTEYNTELNRIALLNGSIRLAASGSVKGSPINQFAMDEYNGYFRIATTAYNYSYTENIGKEGDTISSGEFQQSQYSNVFVLNDALQQVGSAENLAPGERIYSVRFMESTCYLVTFLQVDPLFAIDLSAPAAPRVLGQLKVPGFSSYLHPYSENLLLGIGQSVVDSRTNGMKLSMFNVADKSNPTEEAVYLFDTGAYTWSESLYNHKAFLMDNERGFFGFPVYSWQEVRTQNEYNYTYASGYVLFNYAGGDFQKLADITLQSNTETVQRAGYIGNTLYLFCTGSIRAYNMNDQFAPAGSLAITQD